jgi:hypothetical protein
MLDSGGNSTQEFTRSRSRVKVLSKDFIEWGLRES